jgi:hypothetical protein
MWLTEHHTVKMYWVNGGIAPRILNLSNRWKWTLRFKTRALYSPGKSPWYPLDRRLGGPQSRFERLWRESKPGRPARSLVTIVTELPQLLTGNWSNLDNVVMELSTILLP